LVMEENSKDRIASSIVSGVGFLGAGVIFKDGLTVKGLTTASTIWISAALGMAIGAGQYFVALTGSIAVLIVLAVLDRGQQLIEKLHQDRKSTRLNSSHVKISYAVFCLKKKKHKPQLCE